jgi:uncharacterized membrane protein
VAGVKQFWRFVGSSLAAGIFVILPLYLAGLLLLKGMKSLSGVVKPLAKLLPAWLPGERIFSLLLILLVCFLVGLLVRTSGWKRVESTFLQRIPGYTTLRSLTQRVAGESKDQAWKPALAVIEEALVPAFIIEELSGGRFTVFVPSTPTAFTGTVYILTPERVYPLNISFTRAVQIFMRWGSGSKDLIAAMEIHEPELTLRGL